MKIKKETKPKSHIQTIKEAYCLNLHFLERAVGLSTKEYNNTLFDVCLSFLEEIYPPGSPFDHYYIKTAAAKSYWSWFKAEWMLVETNYMHHARESRTPITEESWRQHMEQMIMDGSVEDSYHNIYLKSIRDGRVQ